MKRFCFLLMLLLTLFTACAMADVVIDGEAFSGNGDFFFVVTPGSYAEQYCKDNGIPYAVK